MRPALVALAVAVVAGWPFVVGPYLIRLASFACLYSVLALSWNFIGGLVGYPSFATAAFFGLGAYTGAIAQGHGVPMPAAWLAAAGLATMFATALGWAILRLRGHYFAVASLVVGEVLREVANAATGVTGGGMGLNLPILRLDVAVQARLFYGALAGLAAAALAVTLLVDRHRLGLGLRVIEQNEDAASMVGVDTTRYKTLAFVLSATFVGAAGAIYASWVNYIEPADVFDVLLSVKPIVMVLLGGAGTVLGPVVGAVVFLALEELVWRNFLSIHAGLLGLIIVVLVFVLPRGLLSLDLRALRRRHRPA
ncbi:MAG TPA: branched-chain amino acid ABC transporter permease [Candidatus Binatia bacterium]|nr:branched-chain amino acid ABC transporter permease [Candidatus Binatia bacterium]